MLLLQTLCETHQPLPWGSLRLELQGIEARLPRISVQGLAAKEAGIVRQLDKVIAALGRTRSRATLDRLGQTAARVASSLDKVLQAQAKKVYKSFSKS